MKVLCLHGHGTSSAIFETQLTRVRDELGSSFEYTYLDGPVESERVRGTFSPFPRFPVARHSCWRPTPTHTVLTCTISTLSTYLYMYPYALADGCICGQG